ncbi:hypothetical protein [Pseudomonas sp. 18175]|uniref:hypothetical protein n=1 Tax=Pseudomonas sp. 18175 TaxID=3390056 RepID=UPI003D199280
MSVIPLRKFALALGLFSVVYGVSLFVAVLVSGFVGVLLKTSDAWVYFWIGAPLSVVLTLYWTVSQWSYVKDFLAGRRDC